MYKVLTGKPEEKGPIQRTKPRYGDTIKTYVTVPCTVHLIDNDTAVKIIPI